MMRRVLLVVALAGCLTLTPTPAEGAQQSSPLRWGPRTVYVNDHVAHWPLKDAVTAWNGSGAAIRLVRVQSCYHRTPCIHVRGKWNPSEPAIGVTHWMPSGRNIVDADVLMNRYYNGLPYRVRLGALTHELGHVLGLVHDTRTDSIMYPRLGRTGPSAYDRALLRRLYGTRT